MSFSPLSLGPSPSQSLAKGCDADILSHSGATPFLPQIHNHQQRLREAWSYFVSHRQWPPSSMHLPLEHCVMELRNHHCSLAMHPTHFQALANLFQPPPICVSSPSLRRQHDTYGFISLYHLACHCNTIEQGHLTPQIAQVFHLLHAKPSRYIQHSYALMPSSWRWEWLSPHWCWHSKQCHAIVIAVAFLLFSSIPSLTVLVITSQFVHWHSCHLFHWCFAFEKDPTECALVIHIPFFFSLKVIRSIQPSCWFLYFMSCPSSFISPFCVSLLSLIEPLACTWNYLFTGHSSCFTDCHMPIHQHTPCSVCYLMRTHQLAALNHTSLILPTHLLTVHDASLSDPNMPLTPSPSTLILHTDIMNVCHNPMTHYDHVHSCCPSLSLWWGLPYNFPPW